MPTKLSQYAEGIMEAAWLAAMICVPVFFNIYSSRIFEPDKLTLLRTLALIILAAWTVKLVEEGRSRWKLGERGEPPVRALLRIPLLAPVLALAALYLISTVFSITPRTSLLGSYQRLQGTYTTFSYVVIFAAVVGNLRKKVQVERLIGAAILASLPVSLYGVLQRFRLDPIPWGGDVTSRVAANLGNSIFVAAYLIMAIPLTLMRIVESFEALLTDRGQLLPNFVRATGYVFIVALQVITLYFSGSRGPWLGWAASLIFIWLGLSLIWRQRWLTITGVVLAVVAGAFLVILNVPNGPLESLRAAPEFYRISRLLDAESRTGQVRTLIWQGASELVQPHEPLEYPDGSKDTYNFLRPLIGYGPEGMYVAYNPFYPPELTQVEKRNASPDRSHNETWDSLVITGVLGLIVYLTLFGSVLYYGLKWLGLVRSDRQRYLYLGLYLGGGLVSSVIFVIWQGVSYLGVALPFGMVMGVIVYLILTSLFGGYQAPPSPNEKLRAYILLGLLATVVAHFVEINFGIAIAATRTYFWTFAGLLLVVGYILPLTGEIRLTLPVARGSAEDIDGGEAGDDRAQPAADRESEAAERQAEGRRKSTGAARKTNGPQGKKRKPAVRSGGRTSPGMDGGWLREAMLIALLVGIVLATLGYNYITNSQGGASSVQLVWSSLTKLRSADAGSSFGVLALLLTSWPVGSLVLVSESIRDAEGDRSLQMGVWGKMVLTTLGVSLLLGVVFWTLHAGVLLSLSRGTTATMQDVLEQVRRSESILTNYYFYLLLLIFGLAAFLPSEWPQRAVQFNAVSYISPVIALGVAFGLVSSTNLRVIQADIAFKTADLFSRNKSWPAAIEIYQRANELAPNEDYYYLFLGRAYLEYARSLDDVNQREQLISRAADDLRRAQTINPLNTDHTANLARLYSLWATYTNDPQVKNERARESEHYFSRAVVLSPNNARLWGEWATLYLNVLQEPEAARERLEHALTIDPYYDWTYGLLGDYYSRYANTDGDEAAADEQLIRATDYYSSAISLTLPADRQSKYGYAVALAGIYVKLEDVDKAVEMYTKALEYVPNKSEIWKIEDTLARLYAQKGDLANALLHAQSALETVPEDQKERINALISQLGGQP